MGFFGKVKQATGIGLNGESSYQRAYEKGVLLGNRDGVVSMFVDAAAKLEKEGNTELATRARANAMLYAFVTQPTSAALKPLRDALALIPNIEQLGSASEFMPTTPLIEELEVRIIESTIPSEPHQAAARGHDRAKQAFTPLLDRPLLLYRQAPLPGDGPLVDTAVSRYYWHEAQSSYHSALATLPLSPVQAANYAANAAHAFQLSGDSASKVSAEQVARDLQVVRVCWLCHRQMQGQGTFFSWYKSSLAPYVTSVLKSSNQDIGSIDVVRNMVVMCTPCAATISEQAELIAARRVEAVRKEMGEQIYMLTSRVAHLEANAHHH